jgi:hypothetical protein
MTIEDNPIERARHDGFTVGLAVGLVSMGVVALFILFFVVFL